MRWHLPAVCSWWGTYQGVIYREEMSLFHTLSLLVVCYGTNGKRQIEAKWLSPIRKQTKKRWKNDEPCSTQRVWSLDKARAFSSLTTSHWGRCWCWLASVQAQHMPLTSLFRLVTTTHWLPSHPESGRFTAGVRNSRADVTPRVWGRRGRRHRLRPGARHWRCVFKERCEASATDASPIAE